MTGSDQPQNPVDEGNKPIAAARIRYVGSLMGGTLPLPYDPEPSRERVRAGMAGALILLFFIEVLWLLGAVIAGCIDITTAKEAGLLVVQPTFGLASAVTGFYYGSRQGRG